MKPRSFVFALLLALAVAPEVAVATAVQSDPLLMESKSTVFRLGGAVLLQVSTRDVQLSKSLSSTHLWIKCADGRERKLSSSAQQGKLRIDNGNYIIDVDAGQLSERAVAGKFEITYEYPDHHRSKAFFGRFVKTIDRPLEVLASEKKSDDFSKVAVLIETDEGNMLAALRPDKAPVTVKNFVKLASSDFYNNKIFHRVKRGFVLQTGGVKTDGTQAASEAIPGEFSDYTHSRGVLSMARLEDKNSATCQFFICLVDLPGTLDGKYASFGKIIEGLETMDRIAMTPVDFNKDLGENSKPKKPPVMLTVTCVERP